MTKKPKKIYFLKSIIATLLAYKSQYMGFYYFIILLLILYIINKYWAIITSQTLFLSVLGFCYLPDKYKMLVNICKLKLVNW